MRYALLAVGLLAACGGNVTGPSPVQQPEEVSLPPLAPVPQTGFGFYVRGSDAEREYIPGQVHILILSWGDDIERIAQNFKANGQVAIVSTHCCLWRGGRFDASSWKRIRDEWLTPLHMHGVLGGIYLVDEPKLNGIPVSELLLGSSHVGGAGYPTYAAVSWGSRRESLPVSAQATTIYNWSGPGGTKKEWARDWYRENNEWIVGEAFDAGRGMDGMVFRFWRDTAAITQKLIINWVWRWDGQTGCGDSPACRSVWQ
jgi:hypothetical protein